MKTLREKITFVLAALTYLLFHLHIGGSAGGMIAGTVEQLLTTAPYCIGFTWILVAIFRFLHNGKWLAWDRIARIFFTFGILFGFYFALHAYNEQIQRDQQENQQEQPQVERKEAVSKEE